MVLRTNTIYNKMYVCINCSACLPLFKIEILSSQNSVARTNSAAHVRSWLRSIPYWMLCFRAAAQVSSAWCLWTASSRGMNSNSPTHEQCRARDKRGKQERQWDQALGRCRTLWGGSAHTAVQAAQAKRNADNENEHATEKQKQHDDAMIARTIECDSY